MLGVSAFRVGGRNASKQVQRKFAGGPWSHKMDVKKNKFVEEWNGRREITEQSFELTKKNVPTLILTCLIIPAIVWKCTAQELHATGGRKFQDTC